MKCPGDPAHGHVVEADGGRWYCPNQAHDGRPATNPAGATPATRAFFTGLEVDRGSLDVPATQRTPVSDLARGDLGPAAASRDGAAAFSGSPAARPGSLTGRGDGHPWAGGDDPSSLPALQP